MTGHRIGCDVPGCSSYRTLKAPPEAGTVFICRKCWRAIDPTLRAADKEARRQVRRAERLVIKMHQHSREFGKTGARRRLRLAIDRNWETWQACMKEATILVAMGAR